MARVPEGLDRMVLTSGTCTERFGSYGAYKWHVYRKVWIVWCLQVACVLKGLDRMVLTSGMCTVKYAK